GREVLHPDLDIVDILRGKLRLDVRQGVARRAACLEAGRLLGPGRGVGSPGHDPPSLSSRDERGVKGRSLPFGGEAYIVAAMRIRSFCRLALIAGTLWLGGCGDEQ